MIQKKNIQELIGNHVSPYIYGKNNFIPGETPVYYSGPYWDSRETEAAINAFLNGKWITAGENVNAFERAFSKKFNVKHSLMLNSGSSANLVMLAGLKKYYGWDDGDEILVSPTGFATTISVIHQNNLTPVFVDIELNTLNFSKYKMEKEITPKTKAIFLSPILGNPPDMDFLIDLCERYNLKLILDGCDSLGSKWDGKYLHEYCVASSNSFYAAHHISTGEGGMVSVDDRDLMKLMRSIAWWGRDCYCVGSKNLLNNGVCNNRFGKWLEDYDGIVDHKYIFSNVGYNLKPLDLQGAIGLIQLDKFDEIERKRKHAKSVITKIVTKLDHVHGVTVYPKADVCWFGTPFVVHKDIKYELVQHLEKHKIQTRNCFAGNILLHPGYKFMGNYYHYWEANKVLDKVFFIGCAPHYEQNVFDYIEEVINKF